MTTMTEKIALVAVLGGLALLAGSILGRWDYDVGGSVLVGLALIIFATLILIPRVAKGEAKGFLQFLFLAFVLKAVATIYRLYWGYGVKTGGDAPRYDRAGRWLMEGIWRLDFGPIIPLLQPGTSFVEAVTGVLYSLIGPTLYGGFLFFSFLAFVGYCLYYRAFRLAFPAGNRAIYAGLIFLYPSWLYWPSAMGEAKGFLQFLFLAFVLKAVATIYRLYWGYGVKTGGDAPRYDRAGRWLMEGIWRLDFGPIIPLLQPGTSFVEAVTGVLYSLIGPTLYGGFLFFSFLAFVGYCLYYRAFRLAFPAGNRATYAGLIFLYPSWLYWPSAMGKDALMAFLLGVFAYGMALLLRTNRMQSLVLIAIGLGGAYMIRPHVAALLAAALAIALVLRPHRLGIMSPIVRVLMVGGAFTVGWVIIDQASAYVGAGELSLAAGLDQYEEIQGRARGGAFFEPISVTEPLGIPLAVITTLFRPFPWEAHRGAALMLSLEGVFLAGLVIWRFKGIKSAILSAKSDPLILFILVYILLFIAAFSVVGNFSILGRQRLQMLPFFFMLLAYPSGSESKRNAVAPVGKAATYLEKGEILPTDASPSTAEPGGG